MHLLLVAMPFVNSSFLLHVVKPVVSRHALVTSSVLATSSNAPYYH